MHQYSTAEIMALGPLVVSATNPRYFAVAKGTDAGQGAEDKAVYLTSYAIGDTLCSYEGEWYDVNSRRTSAAEPVTVAEGEKCALRAPFDAGGLTVLYLKRAP